MSYSAWHTFYDQLVPVFGPFYTVILHAMSREENHHRGNYISYLFFCIFCLVSVNLFILLSTSHLVPCSLSLSLYLSLSLSLSALAPSPTAFALVCVCVDQGSYNLTIGIDIYCYLSCHCNCHFDMYYSCHCYFFLKFISIRLCLRN